MLSRILITGAEGRLGSLLTTNWRQNSDAPQAIVAAGKTDLDITDPGAVRRYIHATQPQLVVHTAAWTDVDGCARDPQRAILINGTGTENVAKAAAEVNAAMLYVSTNEVFDGSSDRPYREDDLPAPANAYGYSKWVGEQAVMTLLPHYYIARTAWLFAHGGKNFVQSILNAADMGKPLRVVEDEVANPTYTSDLADAITNLIKTERYGIYHLVNEGAASRYQFARYILNNAGHASTPITPIRAVEWERVSTPPLYTPLLNMAGNLIGVTLRPWQAAVDAFLEREGRFQPVA